MIAIFSQSHMFELKMLDFSARLESLRFQTSFLDKKVYMVMVGLWFCIPSGYLT